MHVLCGQGQLHVMIAGTHSGGITNSELTTGSMQVQPMGLIHPGPSRRYTFTSSFDSLPDPGLLSLSGGTLKLQDIMQLANGSPGLNNRTSPGQEAGLNATIPGSSSRWLSHRMDHSCSSCSTCSVQSLSVWIGANSGNYMYLGDCQLSS